MTESRGFFTFAEHCRRRSLRLALVAGGVLAGLLPGMAAADEQPCPLEEDEFLRAAVSVQPPAQGHFEGKMSAVASGSEGGAEAAGGSREISFRVVFSGDDYLMRYESADSSAPGSAPGGTFQELVLVRKGRRVDLLRDGGGFIAREFSYSGPDEATVLHRGTIFRHLKEAGILPLTCREIEGFSTEMFDHSGGAEWRGLTIYRSRVESYTGIYVGVSDAPRGRLVAVGGQVGPHRRVVHTFDNYQPTEGGGPAWPRSITSLSLRTDPPAEMLARIRSGSEQSHEVMPKARGTRHSEIRIALTKVDLSSPVDPAVFDIDYPDGTRVISYGNKGVKGGAIPDGSEIIPSVLPRLAEDVTLPPAPEPLADAEETAPAAEAAAAARPSAPQSGDSGPWLELAAAAFAGALVAGVAMWMRGRRGAA